MQEVRHELLPVSKERAQVYAPTKWLVFTKNPNNIVEGYGPEDISFRRINTPGLTEKMKEIWEMRYKRLFPDGVKRNGAFPGTQSPDSTEKMLSVPLFDARFLDWKLTLPWGDEFDASIDPASMRIPINIHQAAITEDGYLLYVKRGTGRASWNNSVLCFHNWGYDLDRDESQRKIMDGLFGDETRQGEFIFGQSRLAILREFNPEESIILKPKEVKILNASCLTLHIRPYDFGYHICFVAKVMREAGEILEERVKYPCHGRIASYHKQEFTESEMIDFFRQHEKNLATTVEPAIVMACAQEFGKEFLKALPYPCMTN